MEKSTLKMAKTQAPDIPNFIKIDQALETMSSTIKELEETIDELNGDPSELPVESASEGCRPPTVRDVIVGTPEALDIMIERIRTVNQCIRSLFF